MTDQTPSPTEDAQNGFNLPVDTKSQSNVRQPVRAGSVSSLNPRSCITCRRRKVRCDKKNPCSNCIKQHIECIFPGPGRAPRKPRKPPDSELLLRLRRLEGVVKSLGAQVEEDGSVTQPHQPQQPQPPQRSMSIVQDQMSQYSSGESPEPPDGQPKRPSIDKHLGRLVINEGRSRYVSNAFWTSMGDEIAEMRDILDNPSSEDEDDLLESPDHSGGTSSEYSNTAHQGFIFGYSSIMVNLKKLHPSPTQVFILWEVFKENVDPMVRILHRPTARNIIMKASSGTETLSKAAEALLFALYFSAVVSLDPAQCVTLLGDTKEVLINRYRFATEQALARANFMNSSSLMLLQAFVFFLVCVRYQDDTRLVWALSGLAIHLAQALGVHRDGTNFGLSPFETEMRRRLWWHISILDARSAEDHGTDPTFSNAFYDTQLPMNINDDEISPEMKDWPRPHQGCTEMSFCLVRFELNIVSRRLNFRPPATAGEEGLEQGIELKEKIIDEAHRRLEEKYLQYCDSNVPVYWVTATVGRLVLAKMWLMAHHPKLLPKSREEISEHCRERLFTTSVEVIEFSHLLEESENTAKWGWLFRTYMQWQAVAFVLSELCTRPPGPVLDRAWRAVDSVYDERVFSNPRNQKGMLWKPMRHLMARASERRAKLNGVRYSPPNASDSSRNPQSPSTMSPSAALQSMTAIGAAADSFGLDMTSFNAEAGTEGFFSPKGINVPMSDAPDPNNLQRGLSQDDLQSWLVNGQMQLDPNFIGWSGWNNPGVGDFILPGQSPLPDFPMMNGQQQWV